MEIGKRGRDSMTSAAFARDRFVGLLARSENWRHRAGLALELGSAAAVIGLGILTALRSLQWL